MLIVLAKLLPASMVGQFGLGLAIAVPILTLSNLQLRSIQATDVGGQFVYQDYLGFRLLSSGVGLFIIAAIAFGFLHRPTTMLVILAVGLAKSVESVADSIYGHLQRAERMDRIAISMIIKGMLSLSCLAVVVSSTKSVLLGTLALAASWLIVLLGYDLHSARVAASRPNCQLNLDLRPRWQVSNIAGIAKLGLPLGATSLFMALANNLPRYLLERTHGEAALGYFAALAYPTAAFSILLSAFGQAAAPRLAERHKSNRRAFFRLVGALGSVPVVAALVGLGIVTAVGPSILRILYRVDYAEYFEVFRTLLVGAAVWALASVLGYAATASRRLGGQAIGAFLICLASAVGSFALVPRGGVAGAAAVWLIGGVVAFTTYSLIMLTPPVSRSSRGGWQWRWILGNVKVPHGCDLGNRPRKETGRPQ